MRWKTQLVKNGRVVRDLQSGHNMLTDWGMDALVSSTPTTLTSYLHVSDTLGTTKRVNAGGTTVTLTLTSPTNITATTSANFFVSGDVGQTLWIDSFGQELKITGFTSATVVTCSTRQSAYLPGLTPTTGPFSQYSVQPTNVNTLQHQTQKFNTYDTSATNFNTTLNDSANSRWNRQVIFLSGVVSGTAWTVNQLGWSDGNGGNNVFGWVNLASPDTVPVGFQYRVTLNVYSVHTPLNVTGYSVAWISPMGTLTCSILQKAIPNDGISPLSFSPWTGNTALRAYHQTSAAGSPGLKWEGDSGYTSNPWGVGGSTGYDTNSAVTWGSYTSGTHNKLVTLNWSQLSTLSGVTYSSFASQAGGNIYGQEFITVVFTSGTLTKPSGNLCSITLQMFWTRQLVS